MKNDTLRNTIPAAALAVVLTATASLGNAQSMFLRLNAPGGVATDTAGNVFVESIGGPFDPMQLIKYTPYGSTLAQMSTGSINGSRLAYDATLGLIWAIESSGQIRLVNPANGAVANFAHMRQIYIESRQIYDVNMKMITDFYGIIKTYSSWYGDIGVLHRGSQLDLYVSGISDLGSFPFVVRIHVQPAPAYAQLIVASSASTEPYYYQPRGLAVNPQGTVLTSLPLTGNGGANTDYGFAISADFNPATGTNLPRPILGGVNGKGLGSHGMGSDNSGKFYVAADLGSSTVYCGLAVSAGVLVLPPDLSSVTCLGGLSDIIDKNRDVAATPAGDAIYMTGVKLIGTQTGTGSVLKFTNVPAPSNCAVTLSPASRSHGSAAGTGTIAVGVTGTCTWAASSNVDWITIKAGASGKTNGTVTYSVAGNPNNTARQGIITIAGKKFTVSQAARAGASCTYSVGPLSAYFYRAGGNGAITVNTQAGCPWTAVSDSTWLKVVSASSGSGPATLTYSVAPNSATGYPRIGYINIGGKKAEVQQFNF